MVLNNRNINVANIYKTWIIYIIYYLVHHSYQLFVLLFLQKVDALETTFIRKQLSTPLFSLHFLFHYLEAAKAKLKGNVFSATWQNRFQPKTFSLNVNGARNI